MRAFTSPYRPSRDGGADVRELHGHRAPDGTRRLHEVKVDSQFRLDLEGMLTVVRGAGLIFLNNPNNPTATVHGAKTVTDFVERVRRISPDTVILIDEAYHEYVTDPEYQTAIPLALATPNVFVARTFSKAYGMAGMRIGYAIGQTRHGQAARAREDAVQHQRLRHRGGASRRIGNPQHIAAERARNTEVRTFTVKALEELGCKPTASQGNFIFVDIGRPAAEFRAACADAVGERRPRLPAVRDIRTRASRSARWPR